MPGTMRRTRIRTWVTGFGLTTALLAAAPLAGLAPGALATDPTAHVTATTPDGTAVFTGTISFQSAHQYTLAGTLTSRKCDGQYATIQSATANGVHSVAGRVSCGSVNVNQPIVEGPSMKTAWGIVARPRYNTVGEPVGNSAETEHAVNKYYGK